MILIYFKSKNAYVENAFGTDAGNILTTKKFILDWLIFEQNTWTFKWNRMCYIDIKKQHYFPGSNRTTCWQPHASKRNLRGKFASVSHSQFPALSINVIFPLRFVMVCAITALSPCSSMTAELREWVRKPNHYRKMSQQVWGAKDVCSLSTSSPGA